MNLQFRRFAVAGLPCLSRRERWYAVMLAVSMLALSACATSTAVRDRSIQERAQARWDALLAGDYGSAYEYLSPGYRSATTVTDFEINMRSRRVKYVSAEYREHSCDETVCTVQMNVGYKLVRPLKGVPDWESTSIIKERWINSGGKWWFLPES